MFLPSRSIVWNPQCVDYISWRMPRWAGNCFGIKWLLIGFFSSSHFFNSRSKWMDCFPKPEVNNSLDLDCMEVFMTALNIDLTSEEPLCTISNILCMQRGKWEVCEWRPSLFLTGFIKFNREQHKHGQISWPLYKILHRYSMSLLSWYCMIYKLLKIQNSRPRLPLKS